MRVIVNVAVSKWRWGDHDPPIVLEGGRHELPNEEHKLDGPFLRAIASAASAGVVEIVEADAKAAQVLDGAIESEEDSLKAYEKAVASGAWLEGHLQDVVAQRQNQLAALREQLGDSSLDEETASELNERHDFALRVLDEAQARLAKGQS